MAINLEHINYGNQINNADTLIIDYDDALVSFCELEIGTFKPVFISQSIITENDNHASLIKAFNYFGITKHAHKNIYINYFNNQFTLCPITFYSETNKKDLLQFNCGKIENDLILTDDITSHIKIIYSIPASLKSLFNQTFPNHQLKHSACVLSQLAVHSEDLGNEDILLNVRDNYIELVLKINNQLICVNQFTIKTEVDVLYYVLFLMEQHQLHPKSVLLSVTGNIAINSELISLLKKHITHVRLARGHKNLIYKQIEGMPQHYNYALINRIFCE
ncbi:MAG: DUF3822 family protein [Bacteroidota bacterium]|jgi:hypothetical protein